MNRDTSITFPNLLSANIWQLWTALVFLLALDAGAGSEPNPKGRACFGGLSGIMSPAIEKLESLSESYGVIMARSSTPGQPSGPAYVVFNKAGLDSLVKWKMAFSIFEIREGNIVSKVLLLTHVLDRGQRSPHFLMDTAMGQWFQNSGLSIQARRVQYGYMSAIWPASSPSYEIYDLSGSAMYQGNAWSKSDKLSQSSIDVQKFFRDFYQTTVIFPSRETLDQRNENRRID